MGYDSAVLMTSSSRISIVAPVHYRMPRPRPYKYCYVALPCLRHSAAVLTPVGFDLGAPRPRELNHRPRSPSGYPRTYPPPLPTRNRTNVSSLSLSSVRTDVTVPRWTVLR